mgnify:CR=1 FL=1
MAGEQTVTSKEVGCLDQLRHLDDVFQALHEEYSLVGLDHRFGVGRLTETPRLTVLTDEYALVPAMPTAEHLRIPVSGGWPSPGSNCLLIAGAHGRMVTRKIDWQWR